MAFKLKLKQVQLSGNKASPFKINESLVMGAGTAAKTFSSDLGGAGRALLDNKISAGVDSFMGGGGGSDTSAASAASTTKCSDADLNEEQTKRCVERKSKVYQENLDKTEQQEADNKLAKETKDKEDLKTMNESLKKACDKNPGGKQCKKAKANLAAVDGDNGKEDITPLPSADTTGN